MSLIPEADIPMFLASCGYTNVKRFPDGSYAAVWELMFTHAILLMQPETMAFGPDDRWCYRDKAAAVKAIEEWDGSGEPKGWHRHPATGRRVDKEGKTYIHR